MSTLWCFCSCMGRASWTWQQCSSTQCYHRHGRLQYWNKTLRRFTSKQIAFFTLISISRLYLEQRIHFNFLFILDPVCRTIAYSGNSSNANPDPGQRCVFPFTHNQREFRKCIRTISDKEFWCGTDSDESKIDLDEKWGICNEKCEQEIGIIIHIINLAAIIISIH